MPRTRPPYPQEFRQQIVRLARADPTPSELTKESHPSEQTILGWINQADLDDGVRADGTTTAEREELRRLRKENRRLSRSAIFLQIPTRRDSPVGRPTLCLRNLRIHLAIRDRPKRTRLNFPSASCGSVLGVSTSGYYAWRNRGPSKRAKKDQMLTEKILPIHKRFRDTYGAPRIHAELKD